ncbi:tryptophan synthase subunit alpha [Candidatus Vidania fulgoroideae]|uniref:tryptophan synthase n=1 Tax=Candidatus Vidania fulgoroideorum TaxID=881286 RepID=A0A974X7A2_9PROT|nr:tryptophan synthase subunit alpha [Candidatus Vidania fulgoroideae]
MNKKIVIFLINNFINKTTFNKTISILKKAKVKTLEISIAEKIHLLDGKYISKAYAHTTTKDPITEFIKLAKNLLKKNFTLILQFSYKLFYNKKLMNFISKNILAIKGIINIDLDTNAKIPKILKKKLFIVTTNNTKLKINKYLTATTYTGGKVKNLNTVIKLARQIRKANPNIKIQVGFGIRNISHIKTLISENIDYIVLGTVILKHIAHNTLKNFITNVKNKT